MDSVDLFKDLYLPTIVTVVGTVVATAVLAGLAAIFSERVRTRFWLPIGRFIRRSGRRLAWPGTLRVTTTGAMKRAVASASDRAQAAEAEKTRLEAALSRARTEQLEAVEQQLDLYGQLDAKQVELDAVEAARVAQESAMRESHSQELERAQNELADERRRHVTAMASLATDHEQSLGVVRAQLSAEMQERAEAEATYADQVRQARDEAFAEGRRVGLADGSSTAVLDDSDFVLEANWSIERRAPGQFWLRNTQDGVSVRDISMTADPQEFAFTGSRQWPGPSAGYQAFSGEETRHGRLFGVTFDVRWRSDTTDWQTASVMLPDSRPTF